MIRILGIFLNFCLTGLQPSSKGTYHSVRAQLRFENKEQVHAVYDYLNACEHIKTAL